MVDDDISGALLNIRVRGVIVSSTRKMPSSAKPRWRTKHDSAILGSREGSRSFQRAKSASPASAASMFLRSHSETLPSCATFCDRGVQHHRY